MTPRLPPELVSHILTLTQQDQNPLGQQQARNKFGRVCRDWYFVVDYWNIICVMNVDQVDDLTKTISLSKSSGSDFGPRIQSIQLSMLSSSGPQKAIKLAKLLRLISQVQSVHLEVARKGLALRELVSDAAWKALAELKHVKDFAIIFSDIAGGWRTNVAADRLEVLLSQWTAPESIVVDATVTDWSSRHHKVFAHLPSLRSVHTHHVELLTGLPSSVRDVRLTNYVVNLPDSDDTKSHVTAQLRAKLSEVAPQLTTLVLGGGRAYLDVNNNSGQHDMLVGCLRDVRHLVIPSFAVTSLPASHGSLAQLTRLEVYFGNTARWQKVELPIEICFEDILQLLAASVSLRQLILDSKVAKKWDDASRRTLEQASQQHNVQLIVPGGWP